MIRKILRTGSFVGRHVSPRSRGDRAVKNLRLPMIHERAYVGVVEFEAQHLHVRHRARVQFCQPAGCGGGDGVRREVVVLAAWRRRERFVSLHRSGAIVESLDVEPFAIYHRTDAKSACEDRPTFTCSWTLARGATRW
jgi:hypothetical protein